MAILIFAEGLVEFFKRWIFPVICFLTIAAASIAVSLLVNYCIVRIYERIEKRTGRHPNDLLFAFLLGGIILGVIPGILYLIVELVRHK